MKRKYIGIERKEARWGFAFTVPAVLFFSLFSFYPILNALYTSMFDKRVLSLAPPEFMGLGNYTYIFTSPDFWNSIRRHSCSPPWHVHPDRGLQPHGRRVLGEPAEHEGPWIFPDSLLHTRSHFFRGGCRDLVVDLRPPGLGQPVGERNPQYARGRSEVVGRPDDGTSLHDDRLLLEVHRILCGPVHHRTLGHTSRHLRGGYDRRFLEMASLLAHHIATSEADGGVGFHHGDAAVPEDLQHPIPVRPRWSASRTHQRHHVEHLYHRHTQPAYRPGECDEHRTVS